MSGSNVSISGLVSNLDTDSIIQALVSGYSTKKTSLEKAQTKLEWTQDAWKSLNTKIYNFYSGKLSSMRFSSAFSVKKASVDSTKATVTASSTAVTGTQKLKVKQLATSGYLTGGVLKKADRANTDAITGKTKISELGIEDGSKIDVSIGGKDVSLTLNANDTINDTIVKLKDAGVNANFDEKNKRIFVSSKKSGEAGDFSITADNASGNKALSALGLSVSSSTDVDKYKALAEVSDEDLAKKIQSAYKKQEKALYDISDEATVKKLKDGLTSGLDSAKKSNETLIAANKTLGYKREAVSEAMADGVDRNQLIEDITNQIQSYSEKESLTDDEKEELTKLQTKRQVYVDLANDTLVDEDREKYAKKIDDSIAANEEKITANNTTIENNTKYLGSDDEFSTYVTGLNNDITTANNKLNENLTNYYTDQRTYAKQYVDAYNTVSSYTAADEEAANAANPTEEALQKKQVYLDAKALIGDSTGGADGAVRITGQDSIIELNGAQFTSNTNNYEVNGLTISANALTDDGEEISITTGTDTQGIYDMIKGFFSDYNTLINEMDSLYNADSAKGYEPLTDDEKEAMSDKEVEKWEQKIKDALLRRDSTLDGVSNAMKTAFQKGYEINGKNYTLSSFGIGTGGYFLSADNEKSAYHIDGNKEDSTTSGNKDKLMAAISSDPDTVCEFFNQLSKGVYNELDKKMKSTTLSSAYTVYNDKKMKTDYTDYTKKIKDWKTKIEDYETRYRKQFTNMEKALSSLNSNSSALSGLLG